MMTEADLSGLKTKLDILAGQYNVPSFAESDPVQFPRRFSDKRDIEISSLLTSTIAWGRRSMILADAEKLHCLLGGEPLRFVLDGDISTENNHEGASNNPCHKIIKRPSTFPKPISRCRPACPNGNRNC